MSRTQAVLRRLEDSSDWLSPLVVKEVRQIVRGREFYYSFGASLVAGLAVAFFGAADALSGSSTTGSWTFATLMGCLGFVGLAVVPLGAFSALRNERAEQTLDLITLTALSPRRVVTGKLLAQAVKLATLFAAMAPFIAMCFLLGGVDFVTILVSLVVLFCWSLWTCAVCLFLSTLFKSRAMSGLIFGAAAVLVLLALAVSRPLFFAFSRGFAGGVPAATTATFWWGLAMVMSACFATMINLVLLAENRLSLPSEDRTSAVRLGLFAQFLMTAGWILSFINQMPRVSSDAVETLGVLGGLHLALVALFAVTEDLVVSQTRPSSLDGSLQVALAARDVPPGRRARRGLRARADDSSCLGCLAVPARPRGATVVVRDLRLHLLLHRRTGVRIPLPPTRRTCGVQAPRGYPGAACGGDGAAGHHPLCAVAAGDPRSQLLRPTSCSTRSARSPIGASSSRTAGLRFRCRSGSPDLSPRSP